MKDIKQYLHLYLGCDVLFDGKIWKLHQINPKYCYLRRGVGGVDRVTAHLHEVTPILRKLSDMSEEEAQHFSQQTVESLIDSQDLKTHVFRPDLEDVPKLLKDRWDLFNLIPEGLAIDKSTLEN